LVLDDKPCDPSLNRVRRPSAVTVEDIARTRRRYIGDSAVVETTWDTATGNARMTDGMVAHLTGDTPPKMVLVRHLECTAREVAARILFDPRRGLPRRPARLRGIARGCDLPVRYQR
jgi:hypothetical protein